MEIPGSGIVNRYIAAQGPLPNTCTDFWQVSSLCSLMLNACTWSVHNLAQIHICTIKQQMFHSRIINYSTKVVCLHSTNIFVGKVIGAYK